MYTPTHGINPASQIELLARLQSTLARLIRWASAKVIASARERESNWVSREPVLISTHPPPRRGCCMYIYITRDWLMFTRAISFCRPVALKWQREGYPRVVWFYVGDTGRKMGRLKWWFLIDDVVKFAWTEFLGMREWFVFASMGFEFLLHDVLKRDLIKNSVFIYRDIGKIHVLLASLVMIFDMNSGKFQEKYTCKKCRTSTIYDWFFPFIFWRHILLCSWVIWAREYCSSSYITVHRFA